MSLAEIPTNIEKIKRSQFLTFIDTTPSGLSNTWTVVGIGIDEYATAYNPQVDTEKWIIEDNARNDHTSNQKQGSVTQKCYKNDPAFAFVAAGRDQLNYKTHILDVDTWSGSIGSYSAKMSDAIIAITSYSGEEIEYDIYYDRRPSRRNSSNSGWSTNIYTKCKFIKTKPIEVRGRNKTPLTSF